MSYKKFMAASITSAVVATSVLPVIANANEATFTDFHEGDTHFDAVKTLVEKGIINGFPDNTFKPNDSIIREHAAIMFVRALQLDVPADAIDLISAYHDVSSTDNYASKVAAMLDAGILSGDEGVFQAREDLTREVMATWLVRAFNLQPNDKLVTLIDVHTAAPAHQDNIEILFQNGVTVGRTDGRYSPKDPVTRGQFATFFKRALELAKETNPIEEIEEIDDIYITPGQTVNLPDSVEVTYEDGSTDDVSISWDTDNLDNETAGTYKVEGQISGADRTITIDVIVEEAPLTVEDVEANSLVDIAITFNHASYDSLAVKNPNNYVLLDSRDKEIEIEAIKLSENKAILTLKSPVREGSRLMLSIDDAVTEDPEEHEVTMEDETEPEIEAVSVLANNKIKVTFSEPMDFGVENEEFVEDRSIKSAFEISGDSNAVESVQVFENGKVAYVEFEDELENNQGYLLTVDNDIRDFSGKDLDQDSFEFEVNYDTSLPEIEEIINIYPNQVTLVFDKDIFLTDDENMERFFHHTSDHIDAESVKKISTNMIQITFDEDDELPTDERAEIIIDKDAVEDYWGNKNWRTRKFISVSEDDTIPYVNKVEMINELSTDSNYVQLRVALSEPVKESFLSDKDNYSLTDEDGEGVNIKDIEIIDGSKHNYLGQAVILTLDQRYGEFKKSTYSLVIEELEDLFGNDSDIIETRFEAGSERPPGNFTGTAFLNEIEDEVTFLVHFNRKMALDGDAAITNLSQYQITLNRTSILLSELDRVQGIDVFINELNDGQSAELILAKDDDFEGEWTRFFDSIAEEIEDENPHNISLVIGRVEDENGNKAESLVNRVSLTASSGFTPSSTKARMMDTQTIEVHFATTLDFVEAEDLIIYADEDRNGEYDDRDDETLDIDEVSVEELEEGAKLIITLDDELDDDGQYDNDTVYVTTTESTKTTNRFGQKLKIDHLEVVDGVTPLIKSDGNGDRVYVHPVSDDEEKAVISMNFTDDIDAQTVTRLSFKVGGTRFDIERAYVEDDTVYLVIDLDDFDVEDLVGEYVTQQAPIADENDNVIEDVEVRINEVRWNIDLD